MDKQRDITFIINPVAGRRKNKNISIVITDKLDKDKWNPEFLYTEYAGHATELAKLAIKNGATTIVAVGGDGTVNEIASACVNINVNLAIIPCGSGNGLARDLKIPLSLTKAVQCINEERTFTMDVGIINGRHFFCTCGIGFDARIGHKFAKSTKRGFISYIKITIKEYLRYKPGKFRALIDGKKLKRKVFLITIANARQYGNNAFIAPNAEINDGLLDVCLLKPFPWYASAALGLRLFRKNINKSRYMETLQAKQIQITKKKKYKFHVDGEPCKLRGPVEIEIIPLALNVITT